MSIVAKIQGKMIDPKKVKQKLADKRFQLARSTVIKSLPTCIRQGYKEQKAKGVSPTVNSIFADISRENLDFYHKMNISDEHIKKVITEVLPK